MKNLCKRGLAAILALVLCTGTFAPAFAKDYDAENGTVHVSGNESWQDESDKYDHAAANDYEVNISGTTSQTVVEVAGGTSDKIQVNIDGVDADVKDGPAADIQGGNVDIKDSTLSTGDGDSAAVEIGGDANVTISGSAAINGSGTGVEMDGSSSLTVGNGAELTVNGSKAEFTESGEAKGGSTGIEMKGDSSLTVEEGGRLEANGSSVNINATGSTDAKVEVGGGNTGIKAEDHSGLTVKGELQANGSVVTGSSQNQASATVEQDGNTGLDLSGSSQVTVDGNGKLGAVDTQNGLNQSYTTQEISRWYSTNALTNKNAHVKLNGTEYVLLADMLKEGKIYSYSSATKEYTVVTSPTLIGSASNFYFVSGENPDGTPKYAKLYGNMFYPRYADKEHTLDHEFEGAGTGIALDGSASLEAGQGGVAEARGEKNAIELKGDTTVKIGETGLLHILGGPVSIGGDSSLASAGIIFADDINAFTKDGVSGHDAIDFQGTGLHFLTCIPGNMLLGESDTIYIYWDIGEDFDGKELSISFIGLMDQAKDICGKYVKMTAGENAHYKFIITNNSSHSFAYDAGSLDINRYSMEELLEKGSEYWPLRTDNFALRALFNPKHDPTTDAGANNLKGWGFGSDRVAACTFEQMLNVEQYLKETGYDGKTFDSLDDYYLYFVNKMNATQHQSLKEVPLPELNWIFSMEGNYGTNKGWYSDEAYQELLEEIQKNGGAYQAQIVGSNYTGEGYDVVLKETGDIREVALNYFYQQCFQFGYGDGEEGRLGVDDYKNEAAKAQAEALMAQLLASLAAKGDSEGKNSVTIDAYYGLDAKNTGNFPEYMLKIMWSDITLSRTGSTPEVPGPEEPGPEVPDPEDPDPEVPDPEDPDPEVPGPEDPDPEVPDPEVPLAPEPDIEIDEPEVPLAPEPDIEIGDPEVPLAPEPDIEIDDPEVPMADVPKTGDRSHIWGILTAVSGIGLAWLAIQDKKRREKAL